jgi:hypothetical protein
MATIYGQSALPGDTQSIEELDTQVVSNGLDASVTIVGGYDKSSGSVSSSKVGTAIEVQSGDEAADLFGENSELHRQVQGAYVNGAGSVQCVPVSETSVTGEDPSSGTSGELENAPVMDPNVHPEHDITDQGGNTINVSYDVASESIDGTEGYVNPVNGNFKGDGNTTYSLDYTYGDYASAIDAGEATEPRCFVVCTEHESTFDTALTDIEDNAVHFGFSHAFGGASPEISDPSSYSDSIESRRAVLCANPRGTYDGQAHVRTLGAYAGRVAGSELGDPTTGEPLLGFDGLHTDFKPKNIPDFGDADHSTTDQILGVTPLLDTGTEVEIVEDVTADPGDEFRDLYKSEIVDDISFSIHLIAENFVTEPNIPTSRELDLLTPVESLLRDAANQSPPLLTADGGSQPFTVSVGKGSNDEVSTLTVGIEPLDVAKTVEVDINVGAVTTFGGASV